MKVRAALRELLSIDDLPVAPGLFRWTDEEFDNLLISPPCAERPDGCRVSDGEWIYGEDLFPMTGPGKRNLSFRNPFDLTSPGCIDLSRSVKRYLVACILWPLNSALDLASLRTRLRFFSYVSMFIHNGSCGGSGTRFSDVCPVLLTQAIPSILEGRSRTLRGWKSYINELQRYGALGAITDFLPDFPHLSAIQPAVRGDVAPTTDAPRNPHDNTTNTFLPFPDQYLAEAGRRWMFYISEIGPNLIRICKDWKYLSEPGDLLTRRKISDGRTGDLAPSSVKRPLGARRGNYLKAFDWRASDGNPLSCIPFECEGLVFPPTNLKELTKLISLHQGAIFQVSALLSAGRQGELLTILRGSIEDLTETSDGSGYELVSRLIRKSSDRSAGAPADWPVPIDLIPGLANQAAISAALHKTPSAYIWVGLNYNNFGHTRIDPHYIVSRFPGEHGLTSLLGDHQNAHAHRFRKSLVRLAVLALDRAPTTIMMILGHRDLGPALAYILADPNIRGEMRTMLGDHRVEIALEVGEALDECAGLGAQSLRDLRERYFHNAKVPTNERVQRRSQREFIAAMLLDGGVDIKIIGPGIVCIKPLEGSGLCHRKGRPPNPSLCQSTCQYRLDQPSRKPEIREIIENLLDDLEDPKIARSEHSNWWKAELIDHLNLFPDVRSEYIEDERVVRALGNLLKS